MTAVTPTRIAVLPTRLANQIAAGEVVERPASVIKELVENSLDAGATRIDIDLEHAGIRRIIVSDNGCGIHRDDLALALARHATSKIHTSDDLAAISSLGFRGEALASIASIARLTLTSRTAESEAAWSAFADGADMAVKLQPAALNLGTRVDVADLFFNTPARRRFLRSESTESLHIEEVLKRAALSAPQCSFYLRHNGKVWRQWRATTQTVERVRQIVGEVFAQAAISFSQTVEQVTIHGFVAQASAHRAQTDQQFVFVNGRAIRDRVVQHAIRAAYADLIPEGRAPAYLIYIEMPLSDVDVNVHPTKHEVRFRHARWMHDLLTATIAQTLNQDAKVNDSKAAMPALSIRHEIERVDTNAIAEQQAFYQTLPTITESPSAPLNASAEFLRLESHFALVFCRGAWHLTALPELLTQWLSAQLIQATIRPLLFVQNLSATPLFDDMVQRLRLRKKDESSCVIVAAPHCLADCDWPLLLANWQSDRDVIEQVVKHLLPRLNADSKTIKQLLLWLNDHDESVSALRRLDHDSLAKWWQS